MKSDKKKKHPYSYPDFYSEFFFQNTGSQSKSCPEHTLVFVFSGELVVHDGKTKTIVRKGEYIFLREDSNTLLERKSCNGEIFNSIFIGLNRSFLGEFYRLMNKAGIPQKEEQFDNNIIELPRSPCMDSIYVSLMPYFEWNNQPTKAVLEIKLMEAVVSLLHTDQKFYNYLFGFVKPWVTEETFYPGENRFLPTENKAKLIYLLNQSRLILGKKLETAYIRKKIAGKTAEIYIEVNYHDDIQLIDSIHNPHRTFPAN